MRYEAFIQNVLDIEESRVAHQGMRDADLRLMQVIDLAVEYYWEQDARGCFTCVLFSSRLHEHENAGRYLGKTFWEMDENLGAATGIWEKYRRLFEALKPIRHFVIWRNDPGRGSYYLCIDGRPRFDEDGSFLGYCGVVRDVTLEKQTEDHAESLELAAIGIGHVAEGGHFIHANRKLCEMLGYSREELQDLTVKQISHTDDVNATDEARSGLLSGSLESFKCEKRYIRKDGQSGWGLPSPPSATSMAYRCTTYQLWKTFQRARKRRHAWSISPRTTR
jgi:PAS domain S-box-containing protein